MIKCSSCGKFISYHEIIRNKAECYFEPDSYFGPEIIEYTCKKCIKQVDIFLDKYYHYSN